MSKLVIIVLMAVTFYLTEGVSVPNENNHDNRFAPFNLQRVANNFDSIRAMKPEEGAQMSSMAISTSTRNDKEGGSVSQGRAIVNRNGKVYETSFRK